MNESEYENREIFFEEDNNPETQEIKIKEKDYPYFLTIPYIKQYKPLIKELGGDTATFIGDIISKYEYFNIRKKIDKFGYFYNTQENIEKDTGLSPKQQRKAIKLLFNKGILKIIRKGLPCKIFYKINFYEINRIFMEYKNKKCIENDTRCAQSAYLDMSKVPTNNNKVITVKKSSRTLLSSPPSSLRSDYGDDYTFGDDSFNNKLIDNNISTNITSPNLEEGKPPLGLEKNKIGFITNTTFVIKGKKVTTTPLQIKDKPTLDVKTKKLTFTNNQKEVINYWNNKECLPKLKVPEITDDGYFIKPTKKFLNTLEFITKTMNGTLFKSLPGYTNISDSYSLEQIKRSIDNFALTKSDLRIGSPNKRFLEKIYLDKFFYNPFSEFHSCPFLEYLKGVPKSITETTKIAKDKNPEMTKLVKEAYIDVCIRTHDDQTPYESFEFTKMEENYFIKSGDLLTRYLNVADEKGILVWKGEEYYAKALIKAVKEKYTVDFKLSLLGQKFVYAGILYDFLNKKGLIK